MSHVQDLLTLQAHLMFNSVQTPRPDNNYHNNHDIINHSTVLFFKFTLKKYTTRNTFKGMHVFELKTFSKPLNVMQFNATQIFKYLIN